jgi:hypothetical protein
MLRYGNFVLLLLLEVYRKDSYSVATATATTRQDKQERDGKE